MAYADQVTYVVQGIEDEVLKNIQARLTLSLTPLGEQPNATDISQWYQQAPEQIKIAMQPFGYFRTLVTPQLTQLRPGQWQAIFIITPGSRLLVKTVSITLQGQGQFDPKFMDWKQNFPLQSGDPLITEIYQQTKRDFFRIAERQGYLSAKFTTAEIRVDRLQNTADITLSIDTGLRHYYGRLSFNQTPFDDAFLHRFAPFQTGTTYDPQQVQAFQTRLINSGYFSQVQVNPQIEEEQTDVPIDVTLIPAKSQLFTLGGGYSTDTGVRGTFGWDVYRLNAKGHQLQTLVQASQVENN
ncbi:MAG: hypothetical protein GKR77_08000, partial [Legionellales bacterium]|nr:hypothetical protein [Legionellales bacterium]